MPETNDTPLPDERASELVDLRQRVSGWKSTADSRAFTPEDMSSVLGEIERRLVGVLGSDLDARTHGVNLARRVLGLFHAERVSGKAGERARTQMVARLELSDFTDRMNDLAAIEREVQP